MAQQTQQAGSQSRGSQSSSAGRFQQDESFAEGRRSGYSNSDRTQPRSHGSLTTSLPAIAIRGMGRIYDMQAAAARLVLQTQASAASAFGLPDYSGLFRIADERIRRVFSSGSEQLLNFAEHASETASEVQRQVGRMLETQAATEAQNWQRGLEELGHQAEENLEQLKELARQEVEESLRATDALSEESREALRQGSEQFRQNLQEGVERSLRSNGVQETRGSNGSKQASSVDMEARGDEQIEDENEGSSRFSGSSHSSSASRSRQGSKRKSS